MASPVCKWVLRITVATTDLIMTQKRQACPTSRAAKLYCERQTKMYSCSTPNITDCFFFFLVVTVDLSVFQRRFSPGRALKFCQYNWRTNKTCLYWVSQCGSASAYLEQPACAHKGFHSCEAIWRDWNRKRKQFIQAEWALRALTPLAPCQPSKSDWWFSSYKYYTGKCLDMIITLLPWMEDLLACEFQSFCIVVCLYVFVANANI